MADIQTLFDPKSIALIGASEQEGSIGRTMLENMLLTQGRDIFPVNHRKKSVLGRKCYPEIGSVPSPIDLVIIATPANRVPSLLTQCGKAGVKNAIIISSGFREAGQAGEKLEDQVRSIGKRFGMRIVGPNCLGFIRPNVSLNATPLSVNPEKGSIAFISQSGAFGRALLDWGINAHVGFSLFASLGSMIDVDFGDLIDYLGYDMHTRSIILYMEENVGDVRRFVSAARGFARNKPIVVLKPYRHAADHRLEPTHAAQMATSDKVYDAVFKRVGVVRAKAATDLFNAASALRSKHLPGGPRLAVVTNAAGFGIMATNALLELGGEPAKLSATTLSDLKKALPTGWQEANPIDIFRDADVKRYLDAIRPCLGDRAVDGVLVLFTHQGIAESEELARAVASEATETSKPILTAWMGGKEAQEAKAVSAQNNVPAYDTPEEAVRTYLYMHNYQRNLELLYETPGELPVDQAPPVNNLKALIRRVASSGRTLLNEEESKRFLVNYAIPTVKTYLTRTVEEAISAAKITGYPVVLKIVSSDIPYKSDVGGVVTGIKAETDLREEYERLSARITERCPTAATEGITVQKQIERIDHEIILGAKKDEEFGSVILFGMGGTAVQIFSDFSVGLPPMNQALAQRLMQETKVYRLLKGYRGKPPADLRQLQQIVVSFSNLIVDFPEIAQVDINPIAISEGKACALDAKIVIDPDSVHHTLPYPHLIITPYPTRYILPWRLSDGTDVLLRPIRPEDEPMEREMLASLSEKTMTERFFRVIKDITHEMLIRFCNIDYGREMAIVAEITGSDNKRRIIGIARLITEPTSLKAEFAVVVHDDFHHKGLGYKLMDMLIGISEQMGLEEMYGIVLSENRNMISACKKLGFTMEHLPDNLTRVGIRFK